MMKMILRLMLYEKSMNKTLRMKKDNNDSASDYKGRMREKDGKDGVNGSYIH